MHRWQEKQVVKEEQSYLNHNLFSFFSEEAAFCRVCQAKFSTGGGFTANLHLRHKHRTVQLIQIRGFKSVPAQDNSRISAAPASIPSTLPGTTQRPGMRSTSQTHLFYVKVYWFSKAKAVIARDFQTSPIVKDGGFWRFWLELNHNYVFPSRKSPSKTITRALYKKPHDRVNGKADKVEAVCLTEDCWTFRTTMPFTAVTRYFTEALQIVSLARVLSHEWEANSRQSGRATTDDCTGLEHHWQSWHLCFWQCWPCCNGPLQHAVGWLHHFCFAQTLKVIDTATWRQFKWTKLHKGAQMPWRS